MDVLNLDVSTIHAGLSRLNGININKTSIGMNLLITLIFLMVILSGLLIYPIAFKKSQLKKFSMHVVFKDFGKKLWMTVGLGIIFFGCYFLIIFFGSSLNDSKKRLSIFFLIYKNPVRFVYLGMLTFAVASTCIYLARLLIKYLYNKKIN